MTCWKKMSLSIVVALWFGIFLNYSQAEDTCATCGNTTIRGGGMGSQVESLDALSKRMEAEGKYSFETESDLFCDRFFSSSAISLTAKIRALKKTNYSTKDYLTQPACRPKGIGGRVKSPVIHLVADNPTRTLEFLDIVRKYVEIEMKDPQLWKEVINAKNTTNQTFLDYTEFIKNSDVFGDAQMAALEKLISLACKTGGVYSKYKEKKCE